MNAIVSVPTPVKPAFLAVLLAVCPSAFAQLTPADIPGPDGNVYPDFRLAGVQNGIPSVSNVYTTLSPSSDDATAIETALANAGAAGGGVVLLNPGTYHMSRPITVTASNVVLRGSGSGGAGSNGTTIYFDYAGPSGAPVFYNVSAGAAITSDTWIEAFAQPGFSTFSLLVDGQTITTVSSNQNGHAIPAFALSATGAQVISVVGASSGTHTLTLQAVYGSGTQTSSIDVTVGASTGLPVRSAYYIGAINFVGGSYGSKSYFTQSGNRGDTQISIQSGSGLSAGATIIVTTPDTAAWNQQTGNTCTYLLRQGSFVVTGVTHNGSTDTILLNQPLRIPFPYDSSSSNCSYVQTLAPITGCGVENLYLQQTHDLWTSGVSFTNGQNDWVQNVSVEKIGRFPITFWDSKFCTIYNCTADSAWEYGDGGTAYIGWDADWDCLMDTVTSSRMRHGPLLQWSASGCVIRNSTFVDSDNQFHAGWVHECLVENCYVDASQGYNSYGYGVYTTVPSDSQHGPIGPFNVVYNNDYTSPLDGLFFGGQNQNWLVLHNRFGIDTGNFAALQLGSSGHLFDDNVVNYGTPYAGIAFATNDCTGVSVTNSSFNGLPSVNDIGVGLSSLASSAGNAAQLSTGKVDLSLPDGGFEDNPTLWSFAGDPGMSTITSSAAYAGNYGLNVADSSTTQGSSATSASVNVSGGSSYQLRCAAAVLSGSGIAVYPQFLVGSTWSGAAGALGFPVGAEQKGPNWGLYSATTDAPAGATAGRLWIHSYNGSIVTANVDEMDVYSAPQEVYNRSFETGDLSGWNNANDNGMSAVTTAAAKVGTYGLRVTDASTTQGSSLFSDLLPVVPGDDYQVRFWSRVDSGSGIGVYLYFFDASDTLLASANYTLNPNDTTWAQHVLRATAPSGAATAQVWIHSYNASVVTADFDDFEFLELLPRPTPTYPSIYAWELSPCFAVTNSGFETGDFTGWSSSGDNSMSSVTASAAYSGSYGLHVADSSTTKGSSVASAAFPTVPGASYTASFHGRADSSNAIGVYLRFRDSGGNLISGSPETTLANTGSTWNAYSVSGTAPSNAATVEIWVHSFNAATVTADLDDFTLAPILPDPCLMTKAVASAVENIPWESRPARPAGPFWRYSGNPVIRRDLLPRSNSIFNSAVVPFGKGFAGVFRVDDRTVQMRIHAGLSGDGVDWDISPQPLCFEGDDPELTQSQYAYDPRVTWLEDRYYVTWCNGYHGPTIGVGWTKDFERFHKLENAFLPFNRNGVLFPRKISGLYAMLSRPSDNGHTAFGDIFFSASPDMRFWGCHRHVMSPRRIEKGWESTKIGAGPVPIETTDGWLLIYHGMQRSCNGFVYSFGAALLDLERPWRVIGRAAPYLISPWETYECVGDVPNVCFPCAALVDGATGRMAVYYGGADTVTCLAFGYVDEILDFIKDNPSDDR